MRNRINTELPKVSPPIPPKVNWFSKHHLWGYSFLALSFLLAIVFIYQMEYTKPNEARMCIQVVTSARNQESGEIQNFPTPCDVPKGWTEVTQNNIILPQDRFLFAKNCDFSKQCSIEKLIQTGEREKFVDISGKDSIIGSTNFVFAIFGYDYSNIILLGGDGALCGGSEVIYEINIAQKSARLLDEAKISCDITPAEREDKEKFDNILRELNQQYNA